MEDWVKKEIKKIDRQEKIWNILKYPLIVIYLILQLALVIGIPVLILWLCWNFIIK